jgi:hypothetical protein
VAVPIDAEGGSNREPILLHLQSVAQAVFAAGVPATREGDPSDVPILKEFLGSRSQLHFVVFR